MSFGLRAAALAALSVAFLAGCASSQQKLRREQREKAIQNTRLYCEFLNGEQYPDIDVALNLAMAQKCDADGSMTITDYKTPSEIPGVMFCCSVHPRFLPTKPEASPARAAESHRAESRREAAKPVVAAPAPTPAPAAKAVEAAPPPPEVKQVEAKASDTKVESKSESKSEVKSENKAEVKSETKSVDDLDE